MALDHRPDLLAGVTDVFNEGGVNEVKTQRVERFGIEIMQKAILSVDVLSKERKPLEDFGEFLKAEDEKVPIRVVPAVREFLRFIAPSRSDIWGRRMMDEAEKLGPGTEFWQYVPEVYRSLLKDSIYVGTIEKDAGGLLRARREDSPARKPRRRRPHPARRLASGPEARSARRPRDRGLRAEPHRGACLPAVADVFSLDAENAPVGPYILSGQYTSSAAIRARGLRAYGVSPFAVNFYDARSIHHGNERISLPFFVEGIERMKRVLFEFATAP